MSQTVIRPGQEFDVRRGDILKVDLSGARGAEKQGVRPALVVQTNDDVGYGGSVIVAPITSQRNVDELERTEVYVPSNGTTQLPMESAAQLTQLRTVDLDRVKDIHGWLGDERMKRVDAALKASLGLD